MTKSSRRRESLILLRLFDFVEESRPVFGNGGGGEEEVTHEAAAILDRRIDFRSLDFRSLVP